MARLVAVAFGQASMPLHQIQALRVCRHTLAVALKLDFFIWELVHVQGVTAIADLIAAKEQFHSDGVGWTSRALGVTSQNGRRPRSRGLKKSNWRRRWMLSSPRTERLSRPTGAR